jgi:hypothetical protein
MWYKYVCGVDNVLDVPPLWKAVAYGLQWIWNGMARPVLLDAAGQAAFQCNIFPFETGMNPHASSHIATALNNCSFMK